MIWRLIQWGLMLSLIFYIGSTILNLLPFVLFFIAVILAVCCTYALLPPYFRLPGIELWLNPDWEAPSKRRSFPSNPPSSSPSFHNPNSSMPQIQQPQLDFENLTVARGRIPNREELITFLKTKVIGQDKAIETLVRVLMGKLAAEQSSKPMVILLAGPTGTGKTETCKGVAEALGVKLVRFDMGEYKEGFKASKLMGSSEGYVGSDKGGALPNAIRSSKKYCILLFDEVEKADPDLWRQLLAFFDEGRITDTLGSVTAPKNTICLLTSNLAAEAIAQNPESAKDILRDTKFFPPEFIGRVNKIIALPRLNKADSARLTVVLAKRVASRFGIDLVIEQEALLELVQDTFEEGEKYGGRGIEEKIMDLLSDNLLDLQGNRTAKARLTVVGGNLRAVNLD